MNQFKTILLVAPILWLSLIGCGKKHQTEAIEFTQTDSLTDIYLTLQDSLLITWNMMIQDDNQKIKAMNHLVHELQVTGDLNPEEVRSLGSRIDQLLRIRYTPKTLWNNDLIEEYDFASESLVNELISKAESIQSFAYNTTLQALVDNIRAADLRVNNYRMEYDAIAMRFNQFVEENKNQLSELGNKESNAKKPLFQMVSE
jgi:hypothetical protein